MTLEFIFNIEPLSKERPRFSTRDGKMRTFTAPNTRKFENSIAIMAKAQMKWKKPHDGLLHALVAFEFKKPAKTLLKTPKKDLDNLLKSIFDSLNGIAFNDDTQIIQITAHKRWSDKNQIRLLLGEPLNIEGN